MWLALKILGWIGIALLAWTLLALGALSLMYSRGWLSPKRSQRIREYEEAAEARDRAGDEKPATTPLRG